MRIMQEKNSDTGASAANAWGQVDFVALVHKIKSWGQDLGFAEIGIASADASAATPGLLRWLELGRHGEMDYMAKHAALRARPEALLTATLSVISARLPYWPQAAEVDLAITHLHRIHLSVWNVGIPGSGYASVHVHSSSVVACLAAHGRECTAEVQRGSAQCQGFDQAIGGE